MKEGGAGVHNLGKGDRGGEGRVRVARAAPCEPIIQPTRVAKVATVHGDGGTEGELKSKCALLLLHVDSHTRSSMCAIPLTTPTLHDFLTLRETGRRTDGRNWFPTERDLSVFSQH